MGVTPNVSTTVATGITPYTALSGGTITLFGGSPNIPG